MSCFKTAKKHFHNTNNILYNKEELTNIFVDSKLKLIDDDFYISNIAIDSREVKAYGMFFAIRGDNNDGHNFIQNAINNGAICIICEYIPEVINANILDKDISFIVVKNTIDALTKLAVYNRSRMQAKVIAITGNVGKTSTRCLIANTLSHFFKTTSPIRNYNNHIGLPYTLANTPLNTEVLVLEMGMNHIGEIEHLTKIARPDIAIITTIAPVHMEFMSNIDTIVEAKAEIFKGLQSNGIAILNKENQYYDKLVEYAKNEGVKNIISIGTENGDLFIKKYSFWKNFKTKYKLAIKSNNTIKNINCKANGLDYHNIFNTLFCFAVAKIMKLSLSKVAKVISHINLPEGRGNIEKLSIKKKKITIINDAYNSSPEALKCALKTLSVMSKQYPKKRAVAIIGDMLELGDKSKQYHYDIAQYIQKIGIQHVITIGQETQVMHDNLINVGQKIHFNNTKELAENIFKIIQNGDIILFKASRGLHFENVISILRQASKQ